MDVASVVVAGRQILSRVTTTVSAGVVVCFSFSVLNTQFFPFNLSSSSQLFVISVKKSEGSLVYQNRMADSLSLNLPIFSNFH